MEKIEALVFMEKIEALVKYLGIEIEELEELSYEHYGMTIFKYGNREYAIGTDEEADTAVHDEIKSSVWAFNASFIIPHTKLPWEAKELIESFQEKCEGANDAILALIEDFDSFVEDAVSCDGRGHFLSTYDGCESEEDEYYIYRLN